MENLISKVKNIFTKSTESKEEAVKTVEVEMPKKNEAIINLDKEFTLDVINTKEFVQWLKQDIKRLVKEQKIAKRDRKDVKHPCPEKRVYSPYKAADLVILNREKLRIMYLIYYLLRKVKDFKWDAYKVTPVKYWNGTRLEIKYAHPLAEYMFHHTCKIDKILSNHFNWDYVQSRIVKIVQSYVEDSTKES